MRFTLLSVFIFFFSFQLAQSETNGLNSWTLTYSNSGRIFGMVIDPSNQNIMYEVGLDSGVYKTTNAGISWFPVNNGLTYKGAFCIAIAPSNPNVLYVGTDQNGATSSGIYVSTNAGASWTLSNSGIVETSLGIQSIVVHPTNPAIAFMCVFDGLVGSTVGLYKTTNTGTNWLADTVGLTQKNILSLLINPKNPNIIYAGSSYNPASVTPTNIFKSYNGGATWNNISNGLPTGTTTGDPIRALSISTLDTAVVLAALFTNDTLGGAYLTTNGGQLWVKKSSGLVPFNTTGYLLRACAIKPGTSNEFYVGLDNSTVTTARGVWRTTNGGNTWVDFNSQQMVNSYPVRSLAFKTVGDTTLYAGAANTTMPGRGIFEYSWPAPPTVLRPELLYYKFKNNPNSTTVVNYAITPPSGTINAILTGQALSPGGQFDSCMIGTSTTGTGTTHSLNTNWTTNVGTSSWTIGFWLGNIANNPGSSACYLFGDPGASSFRCFWAGAGVGLTDTALLLRYTGMPDMRLPLTSLTNVYVHFVYDSAAAKVKAYKNGVFIKDTAWSAINLTGAGPFKIGGYSTSANSMLLGMKMDEFRFYKRALGQAEITATWNFDIGIVTGITPISLQVPDKYSLSQNYPNPFNPVTKISFGIPKQGLVTLKVYDIMGREITTLVNEVKSAGSYNVDFDASRLSSGTYFYKLSSGSFIQTKKMVLVK